MKIWGRTTSSNVQKAILFLERRHQAVRIHRQIFGLLVHAERAANIDALVR